MIFAAIGLGQKIVKNTSFRAINQKKILSSFFSFKLQEYCVNIFINFTGSGIPVTINKVAEYFGTIRLIFLQRAVKDSVIFFK